MAAKREFFSTNEVAQTLGISPFTIRRYIRLRKLKAVKLEGSYRVRRADLEQFLKDRDLETEEELAALDATEEEEEEDQTEPISAGTRSQGESKQARESKRGVRKTTPPPKPARPAAGRKKPPKNTGSKPSTKET